MAIGIFEPQQRLVDDAVEAYRGVVGAGRGRLIFVSGESGSGRRTTLRLVAERLVYEEPRPLVVGGSMVSPGFEAWRGDLAKQRQRAKILDELAALAGGLGSVHPYLGLLAAFLSVASSGLKLREMLLKGHLGAIEGTELPTLLSRLVRAEADKRPVILLLEDVDHASDLWLTSFLDSIARELPVDVRALVMVTVEGQGRPGPHEEGEPTLMRIARREVNDRKRADWWLLSPLTKTELEGWLAPAESRLINELFQLTSGNLALVVGLWEAWRGRRLVRRPAWDAAWEFTPGFEERAARSLKDVVDVRLRTQVAGDGAAFDRLWEALRLGALEGQTFTGSAVAYALDPPRDCDELIDELDDRIVADGERKSGLVRELGAVRVTASRPLWRYEFASELHWRVMRHYIGSDELPDLSGRLADALVKAYEWDVSLVSRIVAKLYEQAGKRELAVRYHFLADFRASTEAQRVQGQVLLGMHTEDWDQLDFIACATDLTKLGWLLQDKGELDAARRLFERALAIRERVLGSQHSDTATSLDSLGHLLHAQAELVAARPLLERGLAIREQVRGPDHRDTAGSLHNLGWLLRDQGELEAAQPLLERALAIWEQVLGPHHDQTAAGLNNLAILLKQKGKLAAARTLYERARAIGERLGPDRRETAVSLINLGRLLLDQGELEAAQALLERALAIQERALGPDHPDTAASLTNLGRLLRDQGELEAAQPLLERALAIQERALGPNHPETATSLINLGWLLHVQGHEGAARSFLERALAIEERALGPDHPDTAVSLTNLTSLLREQGDLEAVRYYLERASGTTP